MEKYRAGIGPACLRSAAAAALAAAILWMKSGKAVVLGLKVQFRASSSCRQQQGEGMQASHVVQG